MILVYISKLIFMDFTFSRDYFSAEYNTDSCGYGKIIPVSLVYISYHIISYQNSILKTYKMSRIYLRVKSNVLALLNCIIDILKI